MNNHMYIMPGHGYLPHDLRINPHDTRIWGGFGYPMMGMGFGYPMMGMGFGYPMMGMGFGFPGFI